MGMKSSCGKVRRIRKTGAASTGQVENGRFRNLIRPIGLGGTFLAGPGAVHHLQINSRFADGLKAGLGSAILAGAGTAIVRVRVRCRKGNGAMADQIRIPAKDLGEPALPGF